MKLKNKFDTKNLKFLSHRTSVQTLNATHLPNISIYDHMTEEQINEEFEKSILVIVKYR